MHILITVNAAWNVWNFRLPVVNALLAQGHKVTALVPADDSVSELEALGCRVVPLKMNVKGLNPIEDYRLIGRFKRFFLAEKPDIILSYTIKNNIFGAMAAKACGIPFIPNVTGLGTAFLSGGMMQAVAEQLYRTAFRKLPTVFFQNSEDKELFTSRNLVTDDQAFLLPGSGIDLKRFTPAEYPSSSEAPIFLMIARLLKDKGVIEYVEAARIVKAEIPDARFQILGSVESENRSAISMNSLIDWENEGLIEHLGTTSDVRPFIANAHCVVLPSYREGAPRTLIEAAAMARPLIATNVPGCRAVVRDRESGLLCDVKNSESLARVCTVFARMKTIEKINMGKAGRSMMESEFNEEIVTSSYMSAISTTLKIQ